MRGAECWTDHHLVHSKMHMSICPPTRKTHGIKILSMKALSKPETRLHLQSELTKAVNCLSSPESPEANLEQIWDSFISAVSATIFEVLGITLCQSQDWFDDTSEDIHDLLKKKNKVHDQYLIPPNP